MQDDFDKFFSDAAEPEEFDGFFSSAEGAKSPELASPQADQKQKKEVTDVKATQYSMSSIRSYILSEIGADPSLQLNFSPVQSESSGAIVTDKKSNGITLWAQSQQKQGSFIAGGFEITLKMKRVGILGRSSMDEELEQAELAIVQKHLTALLQLPTFTQVYEYITNPGSELAKSESNFSLQILSIINKLPMSIMQEYVEYDRLHHFETVGQAAIDAASQRLSPPPPKPLQSSEPSTPKAKSSGAAGSLPEPKAGAQSVPSPQRFLGGGGSSPKASQPTPVSGSSPSKGMFSNAYATYGSCS